MTCTCKGTGQSPGSEFYDCHQCNAGNYRVLLEQKLGISGAKQTQRDQAWLAYQLGAKTERQTMQGRLERVAELYAVGDSGARMALAAEIARVTK